ncbi:penicillin-binding transpeptidase domain-containing protein [Streptomyces sp. NPDC002490]|uniref:penicillin-binding transpeptidase domain-containing protein n=1 Tax=Streptomyces sp. NPDC002490 TaxID=3154416 RepID=UPI00331A9A14
MRNGAKTAIVGGVFAAMIGGAAFGGYTLVDELGYGFEDEPKKSGPPSAAEVRAVTGEFFAAWEKGDTGSAARATNNAGEARPVLIGFKDAAGLVDVRITPGTPRGTTVPYRVRATVTHHGLRKPVAYSTRLTVVRGVTTGRALVDWKPTVVHPELKRKDDTLVTGTARTPEVKAVDRNGRELTREDHPSLTPVLGQLRAAYGERVGGTPGVELVVRHAGEVPDTPLVTLSEGRPGLLRTTLSARVQRAAERAVQRYPESSVVAVRPSTGEVLATANHRRDGFDAAFQGQLAPGSTMKVVTAATLIENGVVTADGPAPCPATTVRQGQTFGNITGMTPDPTADFQNSFQRSCNTAFIDLVDEQPIDDASLTRTAEDKFGLGRDNWRTGIASFDGKVPPSPGPDRAANAIGQGRVQMSPLAMASVTATAMTGEFRQPHLVPQSLDGREFATAEGLAPTTVVQLRRMMAATATVGTGAKAMAGLDGDIGAKTGSAEVGGQEKANSWFVGYRGDVAVAAVAERGGRGGDSAGPIVAEVLRSRG